MSQGRLGMPGRFFLAFSLCLTMLGCSLFSQTPAAPTMGNRMEIPGKVRLAVVVDSINGKILLKRIKQCAPPPQIVTEKVEKKEWGGMVFTSREKTTTTGGAPMQNRFTWDIPRGGIAPESLKDYSKAIYETVLAYIRSNAPNVSIVNPSEADAVIHIRATVQENILLSTGRCDFDQGFRQKRYSCMPGGCEACEAGMNGHDSLDRYDWEADAGSEITIHLDLRVTGTKGATDQSFLDASGKVRSRGFHVIHGQPEFTSEWEPYQDNMGAGRLPNKPITFDEYEREAKGLALKDMAAKLGMVLAWR